MSTEPRDEAAAPETTPAPQATPEVSAPVTAPAPAADQRPQPAYGEYAPEGWSWTPPEAEAAAQPATAASAAPQNGATGAAPVAPGSGISGVPHNLGARGTQAGSTQPAAAPAGQRPPAHAAPPAPAASSGNHYQAPMPAGTPAAPKRGGADRVFSILLLVMGAFGALNIGVALQTLPETFNLFANAAELENYVVPEALRTAGTVGALAILAVYACNLIFTIQRMRARKLAFWVPLVAFVAAVIVMFVTMFVAMGLSPELLDFMSDPDALNRLMEQLTNVPTP